MIKKWSIYTIKIEFITSKCHSITQARSGLCNQTVIEQPIKNNSLWKDLAVFAKKSEICFALLAHEWCWSPGSIFEASLSSPIPSQSLATHEVPLSLRSNPYSLSQNSDMSNVETYSPLPIAVLLVPNAWLIRVEWYFMFDFFIWTIFEKIIKFYIT